MSSPKPSTSTAPDTTSEYPNTEADVAEEKTAAEIKPTREEEEAMWKHLTDNFCPEILALMCKVMHPSTRKVTLGKCGEICITGNDMAKIRVGEWLNDTIVEAYMGMIKRRNAADETLPKICSVSCMFFDKYRTNGYNGVRRWFKDAFSHDIILMPMCDQNHWSLVIADLELDQFVYYDSLVFPKQERLNAYTFYYCGILREFLLDDAKAKNLDADVIRKITTMSICSSSVPLQENDYDCGVFVLRFAECYARRSKTIDFCQALMVQSRVRLFFEIISNQIYDPYAVPSLTPVQVSAEPIDEPKVETEEMKADEASTSMDEITSKTADL